MNKHFDSAKRAIVGRL